MLVVKTLHIWMVISWFAGLFYLPRIFVNLAMVPADSVAERDRLLLMAGKLYKFMTPLGVLAIALGLWLWFGYGFSGVWNCAQSRSSTNCRISVRSASRFAESGVVDMRGSVRWPGMLQKYRIGWSSRLDLGYGAMQYPPSAIHV